MWLSIRILIMIISLKLLVSCNQDANIPIPIPPIEVIPPPSSGIIDITSKWYETFASGSGELVLESGKTYLLDDVQKIPVNGKLTIKTSGPEPAYLWVGKEDYILYVDEGQSTILFYLKNGAEVIIDNIYPSLRCGRRDVQQMYSVNWFESEQNSNARWTAIVKNCDTGYLAKNGGFGTGFLYGGTSENHVAFINYKHYGPMIMELKNPYENGVMYATMKNVQTHFEDEANWAKKKFQTTGIIGDNNILTLTGDVETSCLYNHFFNVDTGSNRSTIAHIGRFTFMIDHIGAVIDKKNIQLRPSPKTGEKVYVRGGKFFFDKREPHPSDTFRINGQAYTIKEKLKTEWDLWTNEWGKGNHPQTFNSPEIITDIQTTLADGEYLLESYTSTFDQRNINQEIYLIYKDDFNFKTTPVTQFGDSQILMTRDGWHIAYNHRQISLWVENVHLQGYYRESTKGDGISLGYNMVNYSGFDDEFSIKEITTDKPMPERITNLIGF